MSSPLVALLEALLLLFFELEDLLLPFLEDDFERAFDAAFFEAFEAVFLAFVALALVFDFVALLAFDVFDLAPAFFALPLAFFSAI
ncbi:MAG TPA: hypothetical protein VFZ29_00275 [Solirubrobacterales bacterium]